MMEIKHRRFAGFVGFVMAWFIMPASFVQADEPTDAVSYYDRGTAYAEEGKSELAIADFTQAIQLNPDYANAYYSRGRVYDEQGDNEQAIVDYNEVVRLDPNDDIYFRRGNTY